MGGVSGFYGDIGRVGGHAAPSAVSAADPGGNEDRAATVPEAVACRGLGAAQVLEGSDFGGAKVPKLPGPAGARAVEVHNHLPGGGILNADRPARL